MQRYGAGGAGYKPGQGPLQTLLVWGPVSSARRLQTARKGSQLHLLRSQQQCLRVETANTELRERGTAGEELRGRTVEGSPGSGQLSGRSGEGLFMEAKLFGQMPVLPKLDTLEPLILIAWIIDPWMVRSFQETGKFLP